MEYNIVCFIDPEKKVNECWKKSFTQAINLIISSEIPKSLEIAPLSLRIRRILFTKFSVISGLIYHRINGPAVKYLNGHKCWYKNGKLHREDGPALVRDFSKEWFINGQRHREDGPAIEYANGDKYWYKNNYFHRDDGPAMEHATGEKYWFRDGIKYNF